MFLNIYSGSFIFINTIKCADFLNTSERINSPFNAEEDRHCSSTESKPRELQSTLGFSPCKPQGMTKTQGVTTTCS